MSGAPDSRASEASFAVLVTSWGPLGGLLRVFWEFRWGSETYFGAYTLRKEGVLDWCSRFGLHKMTRGGPETVQENPTWRREGRQEKAFEHETSETSEMTTILMKMLAFECSGGSRIARFRSRNGFESKKRSNRGKKVVGKGLGKAFWTENCAITPRAPPGARFLEAGWGGWINPFRRGKWIVSKKFFAKRHPKPLSHWVGGTTTTTNSTTTTILRRLQ